MADGKLYITISDVREGKGSGSGLKKQTKGPARTGGFGENELDKEMNLFEEYAVHEAVHFLKAETLRAINRYASTIGARTGDYIAQANTQAALGIARQGIGIGTMAYAGWKTTGGNPLGAAVGAGIGMLTLGINTAFQWENYERNIRIQNNEIAAIRTRSGLDTYSDGSRGTEN